jgi:simple sugar transport system ATP-binding protein
LTDDRSILALAGITKSFPGTRANDRVSLSVRPGEIHALLGENGAGKSTLVKIIYGVLAPDEGQILWDGAPVAIASPAAARALGIGMVFQHFSLFDSMTAIENVALASPPGERMAALRERVLSLSKTYGLPLELDRPVHTLSVGERQRIEIVRCLLQRPRLVIMDEPTSVLTPQEAAQLFETLRALAAEGRAILYISHKLEEIRALCHRATVLRQGRVVAGCDPRVESARSLAEMMIGGRLVSAERRAAAPTGGAPRLEVRGLTLASAETFGVDLQGIDLAVRPGEILGIAGVAGNGQTELMDALSGETPATDADAVRIDGVPVGRSGPTGRRALGAAFVPEERLGHGAVPSMTLAQNTVLTGWRRPDIAAHGFVRRAGAAAYARRVIEGFDVRTPGPEASASSLSGGNLQKFIVGREILAEPKLLVVSQPTWGVDAGAAAAIRQALIDLAARGAAVLVISQDLDEIFEIADRIAVMSGGRLSAPRDVATLTVDEVGLLMGGSHGAGVGDARHA